METLQPRYATNCTAYHPYCYSVIKKKICLSCMFIYFATVFEKTLQPTRNTQFLCPSSPGFCRHKFRRLFSLNQYNSHKKRRNKDHTTVSLLSEMKQKILLQINLNYSKWKFLLFNFFKYKKHAYIRQQNHRLPWEGYSHVSFRLSVL